MTATRLAIVAVVLVVGGLAIAPIVGTAFVGDLVGTPETETDPSANATESTNSTMGTEVSTFMQTSSADTSEGVDARMFIAAYENRNDSDARTATVTDRMDHLEEKLASLEAEKDELTAQAEDEDLHPSAYKSQLARLSVQINALERAVDDVEQRTEGIDIDTAKLDELRTNASSLAGSEIAAIAQDVAGVEPPRGPPDDGLVPGNNDEDKDKDNDKGGPANAHGENDRSQPSDR